MWHERGMVGVGRFVRPAAPIPGPIEIERVTASA
jgi:hypothetical protein